MACPASVRATADVPDTRSIYAAEGTVAHWVAEECRKNGTSPSLFLNMIRHVEGFEIEVTGEMVDAVQSYLDHLNDLPEGDDFTETRVSYELWARGGFGTLDAARVCGDSVYIRDFKYGKGVQVFAKRNPQLMLYALGWYHDFAWLYPDAVFFNLGVVQPRIDHIDEWSISRMDLLNWALEVLDRAKETGQPDAKFHPGEHCRFCRIKSTCKPRAEWVFKEVYSDFENLDEAMDAVATPFANLPSAIMDNDRVAKALLALPNVRTWCKDIEEHAMREVMQGRAIGDFKLVEGRGGNRAWSVKEEELRKYWVASKQSLNDLYVQKLITPPAAEKIVGKKHELMKLVVKPPGKPVLVPGDDPRPALVIDPTKEFADLGVGES